MAVTYKYIDPPATPEGGIAFMKEVLVPLLREYWDKRGRHEYKRDMDFNVITYVQMWFMGSLLPIIAYENDKPIGFFIGVRFVPILYNAVAVQAEVWYAPTKDIEQGMFDYLMSIVPFMNINEVLIEHRTGRTDIKIPWSVEDDIIVTRYRKK